MLRLLLFSAFSAGYNCALQAKDLQSFSHSDLLEAVDEVISSSFESNAVTINFVISLSDETKRERSILINNIIARCSGTVVIEDVTFITQRQRFYNVIFIDDFESFLLLFERMSSNNFVIDGYFLIVLVEGAIDELYQISRQMWSIFINKIDFLVEEHNGVSLLTFFPFSPAKCDDAKPVIIKRFNGSSGNETFYPEKFSDMLQCPIKVVTFNTPPMMMIEYKDHERSSFNLKGVDGEMLKLLSQIFNFKIELIHISDLIR